MIEDDENPPTNFWDSADFEKALAQKRHGFSIKSLDQEMKDFAQDQKENLIIALEQSIKDLENQLTWMRLEYSDRLCTIKDLNGRYLAADIFVALATSRAALLNAHTN